MERHWYGASMVAVNGLFAHRMHVHAFDSRAERDAWVGRGDDAAGLHRKAIGEREAERLMVMDTGLFIEYDGRAPELFFRRFGPDCAEGIDWACECLGHGRRWMFAL